MYLLSDIITYVRRIVKTPSDSLLSDNLIIDYINRFWITDIDARIQLFDLKTKYQFQTAPGVDQYNMPLYSLQAEPGNQNISIFPVYQGFMSPAKVNGVNVAFYTQRGTFFDLWPSYVQNLSPVATGNGGSTYTINIPLVPQTTLSVNLPAPNILRGHVDINGITATQSNVDPIFVQSSQVATFLGKIPTTSMLAAVFFTSIDANGNVVTISDSGLFLNDGINNLANYGILINPGSAPFGNTVCGSYDINTNTINYTTGVANVTFPTPIPGGQNINAQVYFFTTGLPRALLYYNNIITLRNPPDKQYLVELDAYLSPAAFLTTSNAIPFGYMAEYIARGAARKILSDTGDIEQFQFYEPLFHEQEILVWKRSQRILTSTRTETIYSSRSLGNTASNGLFGGGAT